MITNKRIWFITGISSGLGKALAENVIWEGDYVIGTFRKEKQVNDFNDKYRGQATAILLDVTDTDAIDQQLQFVKQEFGRIDVLVNNAGYGLAGAIEETAMKTVRALFEANFFGALYLTQSVLPMMRAQKEGHIIQISSHSGFKSFSGFGIYSASKFALEGFSESLYTEVAPLGIKVTIVEPGPFRTSFAADGFVLADKMIEDYQATSGVFRQKIKAVDGKQEGDPEKAATAIIQISREKQPPLRLPLGKIAVGTLSSKLESVQRELETYRALAESVVFNS